MGVIKLYGDIMPEDKKGKYSVSSRDIEKQLESIKDDEVEVLIDSVGGDVNEGNAIYDLLKASGKKIYTTVINKCCSIATRVLCAAPIENRRARPHAELMIHNPWIKPESPMEAIDLERAAVEMRELEIKLASDYASDTGVPVEKFAELMKKTTYLTLDEAKECKLISEVLEPVSPFAMSKDIINVKNQNNMEDKKTLWNKLSTAIKGALDINDDPKNQDPAADPVNMEFTDVDGKTFKTVKESGELAVGDEASPDGTYKMENPNAEIVIENGKIKTITPNAEEPSEEMQELLNKLEEANKNLETANAEIETLKKASEEKDASILAKDDEIKAMKEDIEKKNKSTSTWKPQNRQASGMGFDRTKETIEERMKRRKEENK